MSGRKIIERLEEAVAYARAADDSDAERLMELRRQLAEGNSAAREVAKRKGVRLHPKLREREG